MFLFPEAQFKRSYLLDRRKMNGDTLSEADMENLRRRMAEARILDVTEVYSLKILLISHDVRKINKRPQLDLN